ncbi:UDP-N-acetylmuramoyl-tripeptide--D-alanyl-D-alanine ligase [Listeria floridensis FSL S10-1187]|uniref:UDP-N-acetylmuramoyl-tripeptide--D-alanyl-D-alanine ligase n=1 Tax=Listeria floridensis FSL S10-1187 TaxID=1265817 RepID=A0ABN0RE75_9LIST|nr:UDP-N-acetylmuramoyl-tripeptide--D-alanyl-D-alanine ligase [Listeria floridensis]EUJ30739.1 UDP-N-acetylmuramoyl-tripeptide--D-alanyl-D-alanine ligase [Listeria floridensis FSL S10-1187]
MKKTLLEIAQLVSGTLNDVLFGETEITGVCFDTRQLEDGDLFIPFVGETRDGHSFVRGAVDGGAAASFWQADIPNPPSDIPLVIVENSALAFETFAAKYLAEVAPKVIAITGSNGKTTTKDITRAIIGSRYKVHATSGNFNNHIGLPYTILSMPDDTEVAILEMGMNHRHEIEKLTRIAEPDLAIITNIGEAHIEYLGSREEIAKAKLEITLGLKQDGILIYPQDEVLIERHLPNGVKTETFGKTGDADIYPLEIHTEIEGTRFISSLDPDTELVVPIIGEHNVYNTMAALLAARELGIDVKMAATALTGMERSKNRLEWLKAPRGTRILNDSYNSSPTALKAVLNTFMHMDAKGQKKVAVVADMLELGSDSERYHRESGAVLEARSIDEVFAYGEAMHAFVEAAAAKIGAEHVHYFKTKDELETALLNNLTGNEWVLFKGSYGMGLKDVVEKLMIG